MIWLYSKYISKCIEKNNLPINSTSIPNLRISSSLSHANTTAVFLFSFLTCADAEERHALNILLSIFGYLSSHAQHKNRNVESNSCQYYVSRFPWVPAYQGVITFFVIANFTLASFMDPGVIPKGE